MSDYPMLISNKLHSFRNFLLQSYMWRSAAFRKKETTSHIFLIAKVHFSLRNGIVYSKNAYFCDYE